MTENYAILRVGKIKMNNVNAVAFHNLRLSEVPNADPSLSHKNKILVGSKDLKGDLKKHLALNGIEKFRKDATVLADMILTASPEFFEKANKYEKDDWLRANVAFLKERYGQDLIHVVSHEDERTFHLHAQITPIQRKPGEAPRLCMKDHPLLSGKANMSRLQTAYAKEMEEFGLSRGIRKSKAHHQSIKTFYGILDDAKNIQREDKELKRTYKVPYKDYEKKNFFGRNTGTISIADAKLLNKSILNTHNRILDRDIIGPNEAKRVTLAVGMKAQNNRMRELMRTNSKLQAQTEKMLAAQTLVNSLEDLGLMPQVRNIMGQSVRERAKLDNEAKQASAARIRENVPAFGVAEITMRPEDEKEEMKMKSAPTPKYKPK